MRARLILQLAVLLLHLVSLTQGQGGALPPAGLEVSRRTGDIQGPFVGVQSAAIPWQRALYFPNGNDPTSPTSNLPANLQAMHAPQPLVYSPIYVFKPFTMGAPKAPDGSNIARPASIQGEDQTMWGPPDSSIEVQTDGANYRLVPGATFRRGKDDIPAPGSIAAQTQVGGPPDAVRIDPKAGYAIPYSSTKFMVPSVAPPSITSPVVESSPFGPNLSGYSVSVIPAARAAFAPAPGRPLTLVSPNPASFGYGGYRGNGNSYGGGGFYRGGGINMAVGGGASPLVDTASLYDSAAAFYKYQNADEINALRLRPTPGSEQPQPTYPASPANAGIPGGIAAGGPPSQYATAYTAPLLGAPGVGLPTSMRAPVSAWNYFQFGPPAPQIQLLRGSNSPSRTSNAGSALLETQSRAFERGSASSPSRSKRRMRWVLDESDATSSTIDFRSVESQ